MRAAKSSSPSVDSAFDADAVASGSPLIKFYRFIPGARAPQRADRSAAGSMPTRAYRYCEAMTTASAFGWYVFPPMDFKLMWDGANDVFWTYGDEDAWFPLSTAQFPGFAKQFDRVAPKDVQGYSPPFLGAFKDPTGIQLWSGFVARTAPGWGLLIRPPVNLVRSQAYESYEGIIETDRWFGPLFVNIRLTRPNVPIEFDANYPFLQVQPVHRAVYGSALDRFDVAAGLDALSAADWDDFRQTVSRPSSDPHRQRGEYAVRTRKRRKKEGPTDTEVP
jgi:hypothetical protein